MNIFFIVLVIALFVFIIRKIFKRNDNLDEIAKNKKQKEILKAQKVKPFVYRKRFSRFSLKYWIEAYKNKYKKRSLFLIMMQLRNGKYDQFVVSTSKKYFVRRSNLYLLDSDMVRQDVSSGYNVLYYHQDIAVPFKIEVNIQKLLDKVQNESEDKNITKALNPSSLRGFIESEVIEKVLKGQELTKEMDLIKKLLIISLILSGISVILILKQSGVI